MQLNITKKECKCVYCAQHILLKKITIKVSNCIISGRVTKSVQVDDYVTYVYTEQQLIIPRVSYTA